MWALVSQLLALLAIPHAAALGFSKLVSTSTRPGPTAASKTMDAAAYATLAVISAIVVRAYAAAAAKEAEAGSGASGGGHGGIALKDALWMYVSVYALVLAALGAVVFTLKRVLRAVSLRRVSGWLAGLYAAMLVCWVAVLQLLKGSVAGLESTKGSVMGLLLFGPPALVVVAVLGLWIQDRWRTRGAASQEAAT